MVTFSNLRPPIEEFLQDVIFNSGNPIVIVKLLHWVAILSDNISFMKRSLVFPILLFSSISLHWSPRNGFLSLLVILWNSAFRCLYLSFSPLQKAKENYYYNVIIEVLFIIAYWNLKWKIFKEISSLSNFT